MRNLLWANTFTWNDWFEGHVFLYSSVPKLVSCLPRLHNFKMGFMLPSRTATTFKAQKGSIRTNSPCDISGSTLILRSYEKNLDAQGLGGRRTLYIKVFVNMSEDFDKEDDLEFLPNLTYLNQNIHMFRHGPV